MHCDISTDSAAVAVLLTVLKAAGHGRSRLVV